MQSRQISQNSTLYRVDRTHISKSHLSEIAGGKSSFNCTILRKFSARKLNHHSVIVSGSPLSTHRIVECWIVLVLVIPAKSWSRRRFAACGNLWGPRSHGYCLLPFVVFLLEKGNFLPFL